MDAEARFNTFIEAHKLYDFPHKVLLLAGPVCETLCKIVEEDRIDLIGLGTHGRSGIKHLLIGSVAEEILRRAPCLVLTVGPHTAADKIAATGTFQHILYTTDFSSTSEHALSCALSLAKEGQGRITLLHVCETSPGDDATLYSSQLNEAAQRLEGLVMPYRAELQHTPELLAQAGSPADTILQVALERNADLIVIGARCSSAQRAPAKAFRRTMHQVIGKAHCPVLTVPG